MLFPEFDENDKTMDAFDYIAVFPRTLDLCIEDMIPNMSRYHTFTPEESLKQISLDYLGKEYTKRIQNFGQFRIELTRLIHEIFRRRKEEEQRRVERMQQPDNEKENITNKIPFFKPSEMYNPVVQINKNIDPKKEKTYVNHITEALYSFPNTAASVKQIYKYFENNLSHFIQNKANWKISIRVNLTRDDSFVLDSSRYPRMWTLKYLRPDLSKNE